MKIDHFVSDWQSNDRSSASDQSSFFMSSMIYFLPLFIFSLTDTQALFYAAFLFSPSFFFISFKSKRIFIYFSDFSSQFLAPRTQNQNWTIEKFSPRKVYEAPEADREFSSVYTCRRCFLSNVFRKLRGFNGKNFLWRALKQLRPQPIVTFPCPTIRNINISACGDVRAHKIFCSSRSILIEQCSSLRNTTESSESGDHV